MGGPPMHGAQDYASGGITHASMTIQDDSCRWAGYLGSPVKEPELMDLPMNEQFERGQALMQMLQDPAGRFHQGAIESASHFHASNGAAAGSALLQMLHAAAPRRASSHHQEPLLLPARHPMQEPMVVSSRPVTADGSSAMGTWPLQVAAATCQAHPLLQDPLSTACKSSAVLGTTVGVPPDWSGRGRVATYMPPTGEVPLQIPMAWSEGQQGATDAQMRRASWQDFGGGWQQAAGGAAAGSLQSNWPVHSSAGATGSWQPGLEAHSSTSPAPPRESCHNGTRQNVRSEAWSGQARGQPEAQELASRECESEFAELARYIEDSLLDDGEGGKDEGTPSAPPDSERAAAAESEFSQLGRFIEELLLSGDDENANSGPPGNWTALEPAVAGTSTSGKLRAEAAPFTPMSTHWQAPPVSIAA